MADADILDVLRASFARQDEQHEKPRRALQEHADRLGRLESTMAGARRDNADMHGHIVAISHRLDGISERLDRMDIRMGLVEDA